MCVPKLKKGQKGLVVGFLDNKYKPNWYIPWSRFQINLALLGLPNKNESDRGIQSSDLAENDPTRTNLVF
jgi:hypothetical protein